MPSTRASSQRRAAALIREQQILQWLAEGQTTPQIALREGCTPQRINQIVDRARKRTPIANLNEHRERQHELIKTAVRELFELARKPTASVTARALAYNTIRGFAEREAKLLGLDAMVRSEVKVLTESTVDAAIAELHGQMMLQAQIAGVPIPELPEAIRR